MKIKIILWLVMVAILMSCVGCGQEAPLTRSWVALDTAVSVTLYDQEAPLEKLDECVELVKRYEALFSRTNPDSDISRINAAGGEWVTVAPETVTLLQKAVKLGEQTDGAFDITVAPVMDLWDFTGDNPALPGEDALKQATALVDYTGIEIDGERVRLKHPGMALDVGSIAKGYIADQLGITLWKSLDDGSIIDLGGNIFAVGKKNGQPFEVGIRDPLDKDKLAGTLSVTHTAVVTSGVYERGFDLDGVRYHHLLDPATGYPVQNGLASVTVRATSATEGDALSTACFVLGEEKGMKLIEKYAHLKAEVLFIRQDGTQIASSGFWK